MKIAQKSKVGLTYTLTVDGKIADQATSERPLEFITSIGMLLPDFEKNIEGKAAGDKFAFVLTPEQGYGAINAEAVVELPKDIFMVDGKVVEEATVVGNVLPMGDNQGNRMMGTVKAVSDNAITLDFNHPMAGKTLNFEGEVISVAEPTDAELEQYMGGGGCGCGSESCDCDSDCDCESKEGGCGCGC